MPKEEITALIIKAQKGCIASRNKVIEHNLGLIPQHCKGAIMSTNPNITFDDLFQQGVFGLMEGIKQFQPERGFAFSTYAVFWVRQRIQRYIQDTKSTIRIPVYALQIKQRFDKIKDTHLDKDNDFWVKLTAKECGTTYNNVIFILKNNPAMCSLDKETSEGDTIQIAYDLFDDEFYSGLDFEHIERIIQLLPERNRNILLKRYAGATFKEIGREYGVTHQCVQQIVNNSLIKLRALVRMKAELTGIVVRRSTRKYAKPFIKK